MSSGTYETLPTNTKWSPPPGQRRQTEPIEMENIDREETKTQDGVEGSRVQTVPSQTLSEFVGHHESDFVRHSQKYKITIPNANILIP
jgi:hypothetical protein